MEFVSKESIRQRIWDHLEEKNLAAFPRPVHHRIPNFKGAQAACDRLLLMDVFQKARTVKVNPDKPQEQARLRTLEANKTLLVPTPRLRKGLFNRIMPPPGCNKKMLQTCASSQGVRQYSTPIGLDARVKIDIIVIGSVAVSLKGHRIGKGEGYADMEYAMMTCMGAVDRETVVVTTVHDCQVQDDLPEHLFNDHDLGVDFILTPTRFIKCDNDRPRPKGIIWSRLTREKFLQIPVLQILRERERKAGKDVRLKEDLEETNEATTSVDSAPGVSKNCAGGEVLLPVECRSKDPGMKATKERDDPERSPGNNTCREQREENTIRNYQGKKDEQSGKGQRSGGQRPSGRRRDLGGMFAWSK